MSDVVRRRAEVTVRNTSNGALLIDLATGKCWQLNRIGADFIEAIETDRSLQAVCDALRDRYDVPPEVLERDLCRLSQELSDAGLIERTRG
ncbi:MAG TPA: PqqD family protein [Polyangia bacterium]|nr:PqqD family protein [Polyangia bacterium]